MKKLFAAMLVTLTALTAKSQITITITPASPVKVCSTATFNVVINNNTGNALSNMSLGVKFENPDWVDVTGTLIGEYYIVVPGPFTINTGNNNTYTYSINYKCDFIREEGGNGITITADMVQLFQGSSSPSPYGTAQAISSYSVNFPFLLQSFTETINGNVANPAVQEITYTNTGGSTFRGVIAFSNTVSCNRTSISSVDITVPDGASGTTVQFTSLPCTLNLATVPNGRIAPEETLKVVVHITVSDCLDGCLDGSSISTFDLDWGCVANDLCQNQHGVVTILRIKQPELWISRLAPAPTQDLYNDIYWDASCVNTETTWRYRIYNGGDDNAYHVKIALSGVAQSSYMIDATTVSLTLPEDFLTYHAPPDADFFHWTIDTYTNPNNAPACVYSVPNALQSLQYELDYLKPDESVVLEFKTTYCCIANDDGVYHAYSAFNQDKYLNKWRLNETLRDECDNLLYGVSKTGDNLYEPNYGGGSISPNYYDGFNLRLRQEFEPTVSDMTGVKNPPSCSADAVEFHVDNVEFAPIEFYIQSSNILCETYNANPEQMHPTGQIKVRIDIDNGLLLKSDANGEPEITIVNSEDDVWHHINDLPDDDCFLDKNIYEAVFDISECPSVITEGLKGLHEFLNNSQIKFSMKACCCDNDDGNPHCKVSTYLNANADCPVCWIPLSQVAATIHLHCPGCTTPGIVAYSNSMVRDIDSYGLKDADDNGFADGEGDPIDEAYLANTNMHVAKNRSIAGDMVINTLKAVFKDGDETIGGIKYDTWKGGQAGPCHDPFEFLYLEQRILYSGTDAFDLQLCECQFTVTRNSVEIGTVTLDPNDANLIERSADIYFYKFTQTYLRAHGLGSTYEFLPEDNFKIVSKFRVSRNPNPFSNNRDPGNNKFDSEIINHLYLTGTSKTLGEVHSLPQAQQVWDAASEHNCSTLSPSIIFLCEPISSMHYFYNVITYYVPGIGDYEYQSGNMCKKYVYVNAYTLTGGDAVNVFPYEFRKAPVIMPIHFDVTQLPGYTVSYLQVATFTHTYDPPGCPQHDYAENVYRTDDSYVYPSGGNFNFSNLETGDDYYWSPAVFPNYAPYSCGYDSRNYPLPYIPLPIGDEWLRESVFIELVGTCSVAPVTEFTANIIQATIPTLNYTNCETHDASVTVKNYQDGEVHRPNPDVDMVLDLNDPEAKSHSLCWDIRFTNGQNMPYQETAENLFIYLPNSPNYSEASVTLVNCNNLVDYCPAVTSAASSDNAGTFFKIGNLQAGKLRKYKLCIHLNECLGNDPHPHIDIKWGWNCGGVPTSVADMNCFHEDMRLDYTEAASEFSAELENTGADYSLCQAETLQLNIHTANAGAYENFVFDLVLPDNITLNQNYYEITCPGCTLETLCPTCTNTCTSCVPHLISSTSCNSHNISGNNIWRWDLSQLNNLFPGAGLNGGEEFQLKFIVTPGCNYDGELTGIIKGTNYCSRTDESCLTPVNWEYSGTSNCFSVSISSQNGICSSGNTGSATASATGGVSPYSYQWYPLGGSAATATELASGDYRVIVTDANGCTASAATTITNEECCPLTSAGSIGSDQSKCDLFDPERISEIDPPAGGIGELEYYWESSVDDVNYTIIPGETARDYDPPFITETTWYRRWVRRSGCHDYIKSNAVRKEITTSISIAHTITNVSVTGAHDGRIDLVVSGGASPYTYQWSYGTTTDPFLVSLPQGTYTVTVTDANNCSVVETYAVSGPANSCIGLRTQTQGAWGATKHGNNPAAYMYSHFAAAFPQGVTVGCQAPGFILRLTSPAAITLFLPSGSTPSALTQSLSDPGATYSNVLAGQVVTLALNMGFDNADPDFGASSVRLEDMIISSSSSPFNGRTVSWLLNMANSILGGCSNAYSCSDINAAVTAVNENFDNGTVTGSFLSCPCSTAVSLNTSSTNALCSYTANGTASVAVLNPNPSTSYITRWSDNSTTASISNLKSGDLYVDVSGLDGCSGHGTTSVGLTSNLAVGITPTNGSCASTNQGSACVTFTGNTSAVTFLWNTNETSSCISHLSAGTYTVTVTDASGCSPVLSASVTVQPCCNVTNAGSVSGNEMRCSGFNPAEITSVSDASGGTGTLEYIWESSANSDMSSSTLISGASSKTYDPPSITQTTYYWRGARNSGCTSYVYANVISKEVFCTPTVSGPSNNNICSGSSGTLSITDCTLPSGSQWKWYTSSCGGSLVGTGASVSVSPTSTTTYYVRGENSGNATTCCGTYTLTVSSAAPGTPTTISGAGEFCLNTAHAFSTTSTNAITYSWTINNATASSYQCSTNSCTMTFSQMSGGATVCVTASNACGNSSQRCNGIGDGITVLCCAITGQENCLCSLNDVAFTTTAATKSPTSYTWSLVSVSPSGSATLGSSTTNNITASFSSAFSSAQLQVYATNVCGNSVTRTLNLSGKPDKPTAISGNTSVCPGGNYQYSTSSDCNSLTSYTWSVPSGCSINSGQGTSSVSVHWGSNGGSITVYATNGCGNSSGRSLSVAIAGACRLAGGTSDNIEDNIRIIPNPNDGNFTVLFTSAHEGSSSVSIYDITGRVVYQRNEKVNEGENQFYFDVAALAEGIYQVEVVLGDRKLREKLVID